MKIVMGVVWFVVLYFAACMLIGGIVGGIAGANHPENPAVAGAEASAQVVGAYRSIVALGAAIVAALGTLAGYLPGTKSKPVEVKPDSEIR